MLRKLIVALVLCLASLLIVSSIVMANASNGPASQTDMGTSTPLPQPLSTPLGDLPLTGYEMQTGDCPMMSGMNMTGASMSGMNMSGMSGMDMSGTSGMYMGGMSDMSGMSGMDMSSMSGMSAAPYPWYSNPWWLLGWVLLILLVVAILAVAVFGILQLARRSKSVQPAEIS